MSIEIMNKVWKHDCDTHTQKLVLIALADNANDQGVCWPSLDTIASKCSLSRQGVLDQIEKLCAAKLLSVEREEGRSNRYTITIPVKPVDPSTALTPPVNPVDTHQSTALTTPVNGVDPNRKEPSIEPSRRQNPKKLTDEEFLKSLKANPVFSHVDVDSELGKAQAWCLPRRRQCTQRFFTAWISRIEKPLAPVEKKWQPSHIPTPRPQSAPLTAYDRSMPR